jgi:hypothetical protein
LVLAVTTLYDKTLGQNDTPNPEALRAAVETFLSHCRRPAAIEHGENPLPLTPGCYALEIRSGRLSIEIWDESRSVSRRIIALERAATGVLDCSVQKFGGKPGRLTFLDLERPQTAHRALRCARENFAEQFRRMLLRQFPGWEIPALSSAQDLRRSFSSIYPRAKLTRGRHRIAAMACPSAQDEMEMLTFALIWHRYVCATEDGAPVCLFVPEDAGTLTAHRLRWLTGCDLTTRLFRFNTHGAAGEVDARDLGNVDTQVSSRYTAPNLNAPLQEMLARVRAVEGVGCCPELNGSISIRSRGFEFARIEAGRILLGLESKSELDACQTEEVVKFAVQLSRMSGPPSFPERQFEAAVRAHLAEIDPILLSEPVHAQVLSFAAGDRDLIDLLAVSSAGRLAVLELKAAEDIHLPMQALDYWIRVAWHAQRGELRHLFPEAVLQDVPPTLLLVAPALCFHPATAAILRYFSPAIDVERVGVNSDWRRSLRTVLRLKGSSRPISHGSSE